jgi:Tfp pilus assembly protein PilX
MRYPDIKARLAGQRGFILPTAVIVLFILTVLTGAAITVSVQGSTSTTRDDSVKASLAAAEAGLQAASFRMNQLKPEKEGECINGSKVVTENCESGSEPLGNGATFQYWTTHALKTGEKCAGQTITVTTGVVQRCITSEGKVNGVTPSTRLQTRVESAVGASLFTVKGILGLEEVLVNGAVKATAIVASNKKVKGEGSAAFEKGFEVCPEGKFEPAAGSERNRTGVTVGGIGGMLSNPSLEKTRNASECPIKEEVPSTHPTTANNQDSRITNHEDKASEQSWNLPKFTGSPKYELELTSENMLELGVAETLTKYYFCKVLISNSAKLKIVPKAQVEIFIDSHADNSECPKEIKEYAKSKEAKPVFELSGAASIENPNGPAALLIEVAGESRIEVGASGKLSASIFAPKGEVVLNGHGELTGAVVGNKVHLEAGSFIFGEETEKLTVGSTSGAYSRKGWAQCVAGSGTSTC